MLTVEKIPTIDGFEQLRPVWNTLLAESASDQVSLTWEWLATWWEVFGSDRELYLLVVRDEDRVVGLAPLLRRSIAHYGVLPFRRLEFLCSGEEEADEICSPFLDFIFRRGREAEALGAVFDHLRQRQADWDEIVLTDVLANSPNLSHLQSLCHEDGIGWEVTRNQTAVYISLPPDWESYLASLSRNSRWKIRRGRRAVAEHGGELRVVDGAEGFSGHFETLIKLHQERWTTHGEPGAFASEKFTRFHRRLVQQLLPLGWIRLYVLLLAGEPVSAIYDFVYHGRAYFYQIGRTGKPCSIDSPGMAIQSFAIEQAIGEGLTEYEMYKGGPDSYKYHWGDRTREVLQLRLTRSNPKEAIYGAATKVVDGLRQIKRAVKQRGVAKEA
jgi:CelD/BcsL family acetyltransferase involved in cellulose biosynthesis